MSATYAWIVDGDPQTAADDDLNRVGTTGPRNADPALIDRLLAGEGQQWRTRYDDFPTLAEDIVHTGRIVFADGAHGGDEDFGPLSDLSGPDCGAVSIEYRDNAGRWAAI